MKRAGGTPNLFIRLVSERVDFVNLHQDLLADEIVFETKTA